jgi:Sigma-70, region 4
MRHQRVVEGLTLKEIGARHGVSMSRVAQLLHAYFGLAGIPPAAAERNRERYRAARRAEKGCSTGQMTFYGGTFSRLMTVYGGTSDSGE